MGINQIRDFQVKKYSIVVYADEAEEAEEKYKNGIIYFLEVPYLTKRKYDQNLD